MIEINPMSLAEKHILVTGATGGIGRAVCALAADLGANVSLLSRRENLLKEIANSLEGNGHGYYGMDLSDLSQIETILQQIVSDRGPLDGLVHCAGLGEVRPLKLCTPDYVQKILSVNTFAFIELLRVAAKKKNSREGASFVGISSVAAFRGGKGQGIYSTAKGAMDAMIRPFAKELAPRQIRLNNVAFGMIHTEMYETYLNSGGSAQDLERDQYLGVGRPEDAAKAICYLLSDAAKFITGTTMVCDGGFLS